MRLATYSNDEHRQTVTPLFAHNASNGSLTQAINDLTDKIAHSGGSSLENIESDIAHLIQSLEQQTPGSTPPVGGTPVGGTSVGGTPVGGTSVGGPQVRPNDVPQDYNTLERSLKDIVDHIEYSDQNNAQALRTMQAKLAQISARAAKAPVEVMQDSASVIEELGQRIGDLTVRVEQAASTANTETTISSLEERITQFANKLGSPPEAPAGSKTDIEAQLELLQTTIADMSRPQPDVARNTISSLEDRIADITQRLDGSVAAQNNPSPQILDLENRVRALDEALTKAQTTGQDQALLNNFETQIGGLSQRLASVENRFENLQSVESSITQLFDAAEQNRAWREQTEQQISEQQNITAQIAALNSLEEKFQSMQAGKQSNDQNTKQTLDAVYQALTKMTERLNTLESAPPANKVGQMAAPTPASPPAPMAGPVSSDVQTQVENLARMLARPGDKTVSASGQNAFPKINDPVPATSPAAQTNAAPAIPLTPGKATAQEDFIAAARRAAQTATMPPASAPKSTFELARNISQTIQQAPGENGVLQGKIGKRKALLLVTGILLAIGAASAYSYLGTDKAKPAVSAPAAKLTAPAKALPKVQTPKPAVQTPARDKSSNNLQDGTNPTQGRINTAKVPTSSPIQTGSVQAPKQVQSRAPQATPVKTPKSNAPISSVGPRMGQSYSLMQPTGKWSVGQIVESMRARHFANAAQQHTGSLPPKTKVQTTTVAKSNRPPAALPKTSGPLPPSSIGPESLRAAAAAGNMAAQFEIAARYSEGKLTPQNYSKAVSWYQKAAAQGLAPAQYRLGTFYEKGRGVPQDKSAARIWYERAAEKGNIKAMHNLAVIYANGNGAKPNFTKAALWFRKAAELGLTDSQYNLGVLNERGLGTPKNIVEAYKWFSIAARSGDGEAKKRKAGLENRLSSQDMVKAKLAAQTWEAGPTVAIANQVTSPDGGWEAISDAQQPGMTHRQMVSEAQAMLNKLGFSAGPADGILGQQTRDAIRNFQTGNNMKATGDVSTPLIQRLRTISG